MTTLARAPRGREIAAFATIATASAIAAARPLPCLAVTDDGRAPPRREHEHEEDTPDEVSADTTGGPPGEPPCGQAATPEHEEEHDDDRDELPPAAARAEDELPASLASRSLCSLALHYAARFAGADDDASPLFALLEMTYGGPFLAAAVDAIATSGLDGPAIADALLDGFVHLMVGADDAQRAEVGAFLDAAAAVVRAGAEGAAFEALERGPATVPDAGALHVPLVTLALLFEPSDRPRWLYAFEALRALAAYVRDEQRFGLVAIHVIVAISEARLGLRGCTLHEDEPPDASAPTNPGPRAARCVNHTARGAKQVNLLAFLDGRPNARRLHDELVQIERTEGEASARDGFIAALPHAVSAMWWTKASDRAGAYGLISIAEELAGICAAGSLQRAQLAELTELREFLEGIAEGEGTVCGPIAHVLLCCIFDGTWRDIVRELVELNEGPGGTDDDGRESLTLAVLDGLANWRSRAYASVRRAETES